MNNCPKCGEKDSYFYDIGGHQSICQESNSLLEYRDKLGYLPFYGMKCEFCSHVFIIITSKNRTSSHLSYVQDMLWDNASEFKYCLELKDYIKDYLDIGFDNPPLLIHHRKAHFILGAVKMNGEYFPIFFTEKRLRVPYDCNTDQITLLDNWKGDRPEIYFKYFKYIIEDSINYFGVKPDPNLIRFEYQIRSMF